MPEQNPSQSTLYLRRIQQGQIRSQKHHLRVHPVRSSKVYLFPAHIYLFLLLLSAKYHLPMHSSAWTNPACSSVLLATTELRCCGTTVVVRSKSVPRIKYLASNVNTMVQSQLVVVPHRGCREKEIKSKYKISVLMRLLTASASAASPPTGQRSFWHEKAFKYPQTELICLQLEKAFHFQVHSSQSVSQCGWFCFLLLKFSLYLQSITPYCTSRGRCRTSLCAFGCVQTIDEGLPREKCISSCEYGCKGTLSTNRRSFKNHSTKWLM